MAVKNYDCFSSENEDGGIYYPPELAVEITNGNLNVCYAHGRYGYWKYIFRFQKSGLKLIGYDQSENSGAMVNSKTSINFLSKKKIRRVNTNKNAEVGEETYHQSIQKVSIDRLIKLSDIKDFDQQDMYKY